MSLKDILIKPKNNEKTNLNLKLPIFINKNNGQYSATLPKKKLIKFFGNEVPKELKVSVKRKI